MTILINPARFRFGANTAIGALLGDEPSGMAIDFRTMQMLVRDNTLPITNFIGDANSLLTYTAPATKYVCNDAGLLVAGTTLRTDYDPITHQPQGLLIEITRTNSLLQSQTFNTTWVASDVTITTDAIAAPDGTVTADKIVEAATTATHLVSQDVTLSDTTSYTFSVYAKASGRDWLYFTTRSKNNAVTTTYFNLTTGVKGGSTGTVLDYRMLDMGNGWYRCGAVFSTATGATVPRVQIGITTADLNAATYLGDITKGVYVWGGQLEVGGLASSYMPTTVSSVTPGFDNITLLTSLFPYLSTTQTLAVEATPRGSNSTIAALVATAAATSANSILITTGTSGCRVRNASVDQALLLTGTWSTTVPTRVAFGIEVDNFHGSKNGATVESDTSGLLPAVPATLMHIGSNGGTPGTINSYIRKLVYLPRRASNAQLQLMLA